VIQVTTALKRWDVRCHKLGDHYVILAALLDDLNFIDPGSRDGLVVGGKVAIRAV
jgi:hypothetical protein